MTKEEAYKTLSEWMEHPGAHEMTITDAQFFGAIKIAIDVLSQPSLPSNLDKAAEEYAYNNWESDDYHEGASEGLPFDAIGHTVKCFKDGAVWLAEQGWHDAVETPSIFGVYLLIHEKGWCVANYMGKGVLNESGWVEAINHIGIEHPQKWLDLRDLIPKK